MSGLSLCGQMLHLDRAGAVWWAAERTLIVADMHLEKGSAYAARGQLLPPHDSLATIAKLTSLISRYRPRRLVALGDSLHDSRAGERMDTGIVDGLVALAARLEMVWITGNHDPSIPAQLPGLRMDSLKMSGLTLRHDPLKDADAGELAGHLHPVAKVASPRGSVRRRAFISDGSRLILPAFGAYAGGLNCRDSAIAGLFAERDFTAYICGDTRIFPVRRERLAR